MLQSASETVRNIKQSLRNDSVDIKIVHRLFQIFRSRNVNLKIAPGMSRKSDIWNEELKRISQQQPENSDQISWAFLQLFLDSSRNLKISKILFLIYFVSFSTIQRNIALHADRILDVIRNYFSLIKTGGQDVTNCRKSHKNTIETTLAQLNFHCHCVE